MASRTHHVHHVAKDPQAAADFYINHFGGELYTPEIEYRGSPYISVMLGEVEIRIRGLRADEDDSMAKVGRGLHHFGIQVDGIDEVPNAWRKRASYSRKNRGTAFWVRGRPSSSRPITS